MILTNYKQTKTNEVILYLYNLIESKQILPNQQMPSEFFLCNKFNCSRSIAILAYAKLEAIGAVCVIGKKGRYVMEHFNTLIKPLSYVLNSDYDKTEQKKFQRPEWFSQFKVSNQNFNYYQKKYYKNKEMIMIADYYLDPKIKSFPKFNDVSIIHKLTYEDFILEKMQYYLKYENIKIFSVKNLVVVYMIGKFQNQVIICARYLIHPKHFVFHHDEYNLIS